MANKHPSEETAGDQYWLTEFRLNAEATTQVATAAAQILLAKAINDAATDPTTDAKIFIDETGERAYIALSVPAPDRDLAFTESLALAWNGWEKSKLGNMGIEAAWMASAQMLGGTALEDAWVAMDRVELPDLKATIAVLVEEKATLGTFLETK